MELASVLVHIPRANLWFWSVIERGDSRRYVRAFVQNIRVGLLLASDIMLHQTTKAILKLAPVGTWRCWQRLFYHGRHGHDRLRAELDWRLVTLRRWLAVVELDVVYLGMALRKSGVPPN